MASTRRTARTLLAGACVVPLLAVPGVASAAPPDHAPARGHEAQAHPQGTKASPGRADDRPAAGPKRTAAATASNDGRPVQASAPGRSGGAAPGRGTPPARDDGPARSNAGTTSAGTTSAGTTTTSSSPGRGGGSGSTVTGTPDDRPGRGLGRLVPPGRATDGGGGREASGGVSTPTAPPAPTTAPTRPSTGPVAGPPALDPAAGTAAPTAPAAPVLVSPPSFAVTTPAPSAPAPADTATPVAPADAPSAPAAVWSLDQRLQALLDDVAGSVERGVPTVLGPVPEPLSDLVPTLLLILGAFLVVQRGIGRGLGHVPMAGGTGPRQTPRS